MDELSLYESILQLSSPWFVEQVELNRSSGEVTVHVGIDSSEPVSCPKCAQVSPRYDHRSRRWRHLDTCQFKTYVVAEVPRVECKEHGCVTIDVPWSEERSRFTLLFESMVIGWLPAHICVGGLPAIGHELERGGRNHATCCYSWSVSSKEAIARAYLC